MNKLEANLPAEAYLSLYQQRFRQRSHLRPSDDRDSTAEKNGVTFMLSNIVPQAPRHNQQNWRLLEDYIRPLLDAGKKCYSVAATVGKGGALAAGTAPY